jgi:hypothetical protein
MAGTFWTLVVRLAVGQEQKGEQLAGCVERKRLWVGECVQNMYLMLLGVVR